MGEGPGWVWERENAPLNWDMGLVWSSVVRFKKGIS